MSTLQFPQGPFIDPQTARPSLEWTMWLQNPQVLSILIGSPVNVSSGGTGLSSGTSGGVLAFTAPQVIASSAELQAHRIVLGGGAGAAPATPLPLGDTHLVLHGNASGDPHWAGISSSDITGILNVSHGGTNSGAALSGAAIMVSNGFAIIEGEAGTVTTVLHGNASGLPSYGSVVLTSDVSGVLPIANGGTGNTTMEDNVLQMQSFLDMPTIYPVSPDDSQAMIAAQEYA